MRRQSVYFASQFVLLDERTFRHDNRVAITYFHGLPIREEPTFALCYDALRSRNRELWRVQVSHSAMRDFVLASGIDPAKVHLIPIGVRLDWFPPQSAASRRGVRARLRIPQDATVLGSFQKDGVGWGEGTVPKLIKGPDVLLDMVARLRSEFPRLFMLLSGPARGYVRHGLDRLGVPYRHMYPRDYREVGRLYQALDVYVISSRQEGGPKAVLEAMASGVPLVTTKVGQAMDLVRPGVNGWMVDVEDAGGLAASVVDAVAPGKRIESIIAEARRTAAANAYEAQSQLWDRFFRGFVEPS